LKSLHDLYPFLLLLCDEIISYYKDLTHLTKEERDVRNFDHPNALDTDLMIADLKKLRDMEAVQIPVYDFKTHTRKVDTENINPRRVILIEGVLIFADEELASLIDIKIFVDTESDIRFIRRLQRDVVERQRDVESVIEQYMNSVKPMHTLFVEPSKQKADIIIPSGYNSVALDLVSHRLRAVIIATSPVCKERKQMGFENDSD
jgi:uridine kinase